MKKGFIRRTDRASVSDVQIDADKRPRLFEIAVTLFIISAVFIRNPIFLTAPRIWAEEGSIYIQAILDYGLVGSIFTPHLGYYSLVPNLATVASVSTLGLKWAAYGTTYVSLAIMMPCVLAPLYLPSHYWRNDFVRFTLPIAGILMSSAEIWLNTINIQYYTGLFACYLLLTDFSRLSTRLHYFSICMLTVAVLNGVTAVVLFPLFLHKAYLARSIPDLPPMARRKQKTVCVVVGGGLVLQLAAFAVGGMDGASRLSVANLENLPMGLFRTMFYVVQGNATLVSAVFGAAMIVFGAWALITTKKTWLIALLVAWTSFVFSLLSIDMMGGARYSFIPSVLTVLLLVNWRPRGGKNPTVALLSTLLLFAIYKMMFFASTEEFYDSDWRSFAEEYEIYRQTESGHIAVFPQWPDTEWKIRLP